MGQLMENTKKDILGYKWPIQQTAVFTRGGNFVSSIYTDTIPC